MVLCLSWRAFSSIAWPNILSAEENLKKRLGSSKPNSTILVSEIRNKEVMSSDRASRCVADERLLWIWRGGGLAL